MAADPDGVHPGSGSYRQEKIGSRFQSRKTPSFVSATLDLYVSYNSDLIKAFDVNMSRNLICTGNQIQKRSDIHPFPYSITWKKEHSRW